MAYTCYILLINSDQLGQLLSYLFKNFEGFVVHFSKNSLLKVCTGKVCSETPKCSCQKMNFSLHKTKFEDYPFFLII